MPECEVKLFVDIKHLNQHCIEKSPFEAFIPLATRWRQSSTGEPTPLDENFKFLDLL